MYHGNKNVGLESVACAAVRQNHTAVIIFIGHFCLLELDLVFSVLSSQFSPDTVYLDGNEKKLAASC